jgi:uncharacterized protein with HEPN domain
MPRDVEYLREILEAIDSIQDVLSFADFDRLMQTRYLRSAILHELTVIGEACARLPGRSLRTPSGRSAESIS